MASSRIRGITVEIGGDTVGLQSALRDVNRRTKDLQTELKDVERLLKFDPNNAELLAQRQQLLSQQIEATTDKLNQLRQAEAQVQAQFERGEIGEEQYRGFRRELQQTEQQLQSYQQSLVDMDREQERVGQGTRQLSAFFEATGTSVQDYANVIGNRLVTAIGNGTATARDLEYAFQRIGREAIGAEGDIERLRTTLASVDDGNSFENIRNDLRQLQTEADQTGEAVEGIGIELENVAGALVAGGGIAGVLEQALDMSSLDTQIDITLNIPEESKQAVKYAIRGIEAYGLETEEAFEGVRRQWVLNKDASDAANTTIAKGAAAISKAYSDIDFIELIQEVNEIGKELKINDDQALSLVDTLLKVGFPPDQLDIIAEYGAQLQRAGYDATEIQGIFAAGVETGTWNIDVLLDGLKEGRIVLAEFGTGVDDSTKELIKGTSISAGELQKWGKAIAEGGEKGKTAYTEVAKAVASIDDQTKRNQVGVKLFGTLYEENGEKITQSILNAENQTKSLDEMMNGLYETMGKTNADPMVELQQALANLKIALEPLLLMITSFISIIAEWAASNPQLVATIVAIGTTLGILIGIIMALAPIVTGIVALMTQFSLSLGAILTPVGIAIGAIAALVAAGVLLYQNWETVKNFALSIWSMIGEHFGGVFEQIKGYVLAGMQFVQSTIQSILSEAVAFAQGLLDSFSAFWKENGDQITSIVKGAMSLVASLISGNLQYVKGLFQVIMPIISGVVKIAWGIISGVTKSTVDLILGIIQFFLKIFQGDWEGAFKTVAETASKIMRNIVSTFQDIDLLQIGKDIVSGLINGISSMADGVWDAVKSIGNSIKDVFTSMFDINSPSRVFEGYGVNLNEGLVKGIQQSSRQLKNAVNNTYGSISDSAGKMMDVNQSSYRVRSIKSDSNNQHPASKTKQPLIVQLVLQDGRLLAEHLVDDITEMQDFKKYRFA
ncbi:hypothetical protein [Sporosarcina globispora]|uniref:hypothetical protein n=1 Tax=Sporosarcina globispora TaxID=1459 RepID=UPI0006A9DBB6|nr:hypothetical protein [Sporosarcina globispora]